MYNLRKALLASNKGARAGTGTKGSNRRRRGRGSAHIEILQDSPLPPSAVFGLIPLKPPPAITHTEYLALIHTTRGVDGQTGAATSTEDDTAVADGGAIGGGTSTGETRTSTGGRQAELTHRE